MSNEEILDPIICFKALEIGFHSVELNCSLHVLNLFSCTFIVFAVVETFSCSILSHPCRQGLWFASCSMLGHPGQHVPELQPVS